MPRRLEWITLIAAFAGGFAQAPGLLIPLAALALMADGVIGKIWRLRQTPAVPLTSKMITYLVTGALGALAAAALAYAVGGWVRGWI